MASATKTKTKTKKPTKAKKQAKKVAKATPKKAPASKTPVVSAKEKTKQAKAPAAKIAPARSAPPMAEVDSDVLEFIAAIDAFKKKHSRPFPSWSEVLLVVRELGYSRAN